MRVTAVKRTLTFVKMSATAPPKLLKRRSWGKTKHREVTVVNQEKIEEALQSLAEEAARKAESPDEATCKETGVDLQYPELMSDGALISALKRIKVPIPVYSDGRPSRERLLYLYKMNVLPRPQRNHWKRKRRQLHVSAASQGNEGGGTAMEVDDWCLNGAQGQGNGAELQRKRKLPGPEGIPPAKKLSVDPPNDLIPTTPETPSPTVAMGTLNLQDDIIKHNTNKVVRLKKRPASSVTSHIRPLGNARTEPGRGNTPDAAKKLCREKIMWP